MSFILNTLNTLMVFAEVKWPNIKAVVLCTGNRNRSNNSPEKDPTSHIRCCN